MWSESPHANLVIWILVIWGALVVFGIIKVIKHMKE